MLKVEGRGRQAKAEIEKWIGLGARPHRVLFFAPSRKARTDSEKKNSK
jgi:hypothetical protein